MAKINHDAVARYFALTGVAKLCAQQGVLPPMILLETMRQVLETAFVPESENETLTSTQRIFREEVERKKHDLEIAMAGVRRAYATGHRKFVEVLPTMDPQSMVDFLCNEPTVPLELRATMSDIFKTRTNENLH